MNLTSFNPLLFKFLTFFILIKYVSGADKRLCGDSKCETVISEGVAKSNYNPIDPKVVALKINTPIRIYAKPYEDKKDALWLIEIQGRRGWAPKNFILEQKMIVKTNNLVLVEYQGVDSKTLASTMEVKSSEASHEETTTTSPLSEDEIPKKIVEQSPEPTKLQDKVESTVVQPNVIDGTTIASEPSTQANDETKIENINDMVENQTQDFDDGKVEDDDYDENYGDSQDDDDDEVEEEEVEEELTNKNESNRKTIVDEIESKINLKGTQYANKNLENINANTEDKTENMLNSMENKENIMNSKTDHQIKSDMQQNMSNEKSTVVASPELENKQNLESKSDKSVENENNMIIEDQDRKDEKIIDAYEPNTLDSEQQRIKEKQSNDDIDQSKSSQQDQENMKDNINNSDQKIDIPISESENNNEKLKVEMAINDKSEESKQFRNEDLQSQLQPKTNIETVSQPGSINVDPIENLELPLGQNENVDMNFNQNQNIPSRENEENSIKLIEKPEDDNFNHNKEANIDQGVHTKPNHPNSKLNESFVTNEVSSEELAENQKHQNENLQPEFNQNENLHHHYDGVPPLFKHNEVPVTNFNEHIDKISENNKNNIIKNFDHGNFRNDNQENSHAQGDEPQFSEMNSSPDQGRTESITTLGYNQGDDYVDIPTETTTANPTKNEIDYKINEENLDEQKNNINQRHVEPVDPQPLVTNTAENEDSNTDEANESDMFSSAINMFNTYTDILIDAINGFWNNKQENIPNQSSHNEINQPTEAVYKKENNFKNSFEEPRSTFDNEYCEKIGPNSNCPKTGRRERHPFDPNSYTESDFFTSMSDKILEMFDMLVLLSITAVSSIIFAFGYYCICNGRKESFLINKLNIVERNLMAANNEVTILKQELQDSKLKLSSAEEGSFGTNKMIVVLKKQLDEKHKEKDLLKEQIITLEKELQNTAEAGVELNRIIADLMSKQKDSEILCSKIEDLEKEIEFQQETINEINQTLVEKCTQNNELQALLTERSNKYETHINDLQSKIDDLQDEKLLMQSKFDDDIKQLQEEMEEKFKSKSEELVRLESVYQSEKQNHEDLQRKWQTSESKIESLKEVIRNMNKESWADIDDLIETVDIKADNLLLEKENSTLKERLDGEKDARKLMEQHIKTLSEEIEILKKEHIQADKSKLEAETRLDVLSKYFKEKEANLQKELTLKEALWMKHQGETTNTVEKVKSMQDEIQALKSQNESLHAEIDAQALAHKTQLAAVESRAHENWLQSKQAERKYEEARSEASLLRQKLTALVTNNQSASSNNTGSSNDINRLQNPTTDGGLETTNLNSVPSPVHLIDSSNSPSLPLASAANLPPPPPPFLPPLPFMPPLPPRTYMGMPPGPFHQLPPPPPHNRLPPLGGRLISPPPPHHKQNSRRSTRSYSPSIIDDDYYDDDDDYYDDDDDIGKHNYKRNNHNRNYSPENGGRYSPDSRYNYTTDVMSQYDTETDFSPQVSPREESFLNNRGRRGGSINRDIRHMERSTPIERSNSSNKNFKPLTPTPLKKANSSMLNSSENRSNNSNSNKGKHSSGSEKSFDSRISKGKARV